MNGDCGRCDERILARLLMLGARLARPSRSAAQGAAWDGAARDGAVGRIPISFTL